MILKDQLYVAEWLNSKIPQVSDAEPALLREFLLDFLKEECADEGKDEFVQAVCALTEGIIRDREAFAQEFYDVIISSQQPLRDAENWVAIYDVPQEKCKQRDIVQEFEQFGSISSFKLFGSTKHGRRIALVKYVNESMAKACIESTTPFFNDRFVQVDTVAAKVAEFPPTTPIGQLSTQLNVKSRQLVFYREKLKRLQAMMESVEPSDLAKVAQCSRHFKAFLEELERKQLTPSLLYHLRSRLKDLLIDPKTYVKPKRSSRKRIRI